MRTNEQQHQYFFLNTAVNNSQMRQVVIFLFQILLKSDGKNSVIIFPIQVFVGIGTKFMDTIHLEININRTIPWI